MKTAKLTLMMLACAAAMPAFAQNTTDSRCGATNYDRSRDMFTIVRPNSSTPNQQCFITVVPKSSWQGGANDPSSSQFIEGNYQITVSGAGGGGGAGSRRAAGSGADDGAVSTVSRYLAPGTYRLTLGDGGAGGTAGQRSVDGAPSSLMNTGTGETVAGFAGAENYNGSVQKAPAKGGAAGGPDQSGTSGAGGDGGVRSRDRNATTGSEGGNGFIKLALVDMIQPRAAAPAPYVQAAAPAYVEPARSTSAAYVEPAPVAMRPAKRDRN